MAHPLRDVLRLYAEEDAPFEDVAREVAKADRAEAVAEVRRAEGLRWIGPEDAEILMRGAVLG